MKKQLTATDIKAWRRETGLNQPEFGEMLGISRATLARIEAGENDVPAWMAWAYRGWVTENEPEGGATRGLEDAIRQIVREETRKQDNAFGCLVDLLQKRGILDPEDLGKIQAA